MNQKKITEAYRQQVIRERQEELHREYLDSRNEYCLMRYEPEWDYYSYGDTFQYAWIRESDGDYFGLHYYGDTLVNPEWIDDWTDETNRPLIEPIYRNSIVTFDDLITEVQGDNQTPSMTGKCEACGTYIWCPFCKHDDIVHKCSCGEPVTLTKFVNRIMLPEITE